MSDDSVPHTIYDIQTPCFLVDIEKVKNNAQTMISRSKDLGLQLRPHMKTHKCLEIGKIATGGTKRCIVVSTLSEAEMFADGGFDDIVFGQLFTLDKMPRLKQLASRLNIFHVFVDSDFGIKMLEDNQLANKKWSIIMKVDCGNARAGVLWDSDKGIELARRISTSKACTFYGIYSHEGQAYHSKGSADIEKVSYLSTERMLDLAKRIRAAGIECHSVAVGSTPTASRPDEIMKQLTELHPGNYLFYDAQQFSIGACQKDNIAVKVATRVIGQYPHRNQLLVDAGWMSLTLDGNKALPGGSYCLIENQPNLRLVKMTQEVGLLEPIEGKLNYDNYPIGKVLFLIPYHSCATASMYSAYYVHEGDKVFDIYKPCRGW